MFKQVNVSGIEFQFFKRMNHYDLVEGHGWRKTVIGLKNNEILGSN